MQVLLILLLFPAFSHRAMSEDVRILHVSCTSSSRYHHVIVVAVFEVHVDALARFAELSVHDFKRANLRRQVRSRLTEF